VASYYRALSFYLEEEPNLLTDLLTVLIPRINHARVVRMFRNQDHLPLIRQYLIAVQHVRHVLVEPQVLLTALPSS
jgi:clathrin heavy chain